MAHRLLHVRREVRVESAPLLRFFIGNRLLFAAEGVLQLQSSLLSANFAPLCVAKFIRERDNKVGLANVRGHKCTFLILFYLQSQPGETAPANPELFLFDPYLFSCKLVFHKGSTLR